MKRTYSISLLAFVVCLLGAKPVLAQPPCGTGQPAATATLGVASSAFPWAAPTIPVAPPWTNWSAPTAPGTALLVPCNTAGYGVNCNVCPGSWRLTMTAGQRLQFYMCVGQSYTISTCLTTPAWDSRLVVTTSAAAATILAWDEDGCGGGAFGGLSQLTFTPTISTSYFIRLFEASGANCVNNAARSAFITIDCASSGCPPAGDNPCSVSPAASCNPNIPNCPAPAAAFAFPTLGPACTTLSATTSGASGTSGVPPPPCGAYSNSGDIWFTATSSATGTLALDVTHVSATNLAMALYSVTGACPTPTLALVTGACNDDIVFGVQLDPFLSFSTLAPGTLYYVRVWPQANASVGGTFQLCAYHPVPPPNDQPCGAIALNIASPVCVPATFNTQDATALSGVAVSPVTSPTCTAGVAGNDVWFSITTTVLGRVTVTSIAGSITSMGMALYTGPCAGTLTEIGCSAVGMPEILTAAVYPAGTVIYVRMWSLTTGFGSFQLCSTMLQPPPNDNPCGAIAISPQFGCLMTGISSQNATITPTGLFGAGSVPNPSCGGVPNSDVWYSVVVPPNGQMALDMDDAQMNNAAAAVYRLAGTCPGGGNFTQVAGACFTGGSTNVGAANMPAGQVNGLTPGETVYVRVWLESGSDGTAHLCARRTDAIPVVTSVSCFYTLRMQDSAGNGWNGSFVTITVGGVPTPYTINSGSGTISFPVNQGQVVTVEYTAVGGFQNEISFSVVNQTGGLIMASSAPANLTNAFAGTGNCNVPPPPQSDCGGAFRICQGGSGLGGNPTNTGGVVDLNASNRGCLSSNERQGLWYSFSAATSGTIDFLITPPGGADYDFGVWGPYPSAPVCGSGPVGPPLRCSYSGLQGPTGLTQTAGDLTEGAGGDRYVRYLDVTVGQYYLVYVDNFSMNGISFSLSFGGTATISCIILPVELMEFDAQALNRQVDVNWSTASETNSSHFLVERSTDGAYFEPLGSVNAAGNSTSRNDYKFVDPSPVNGLNFYRLRQVDRDDEFALSEVKAVVFRDSGIPLHVFPNPANDILQASFGSTSEGVIRWRVLDNSGRLVGDGSTSRFVGNNRFEVPVNKLDAGSYFLEVLDGQGALIGNARFMRQ